MENNLWNKEHAINLGFLQPKALYLISMEDILAITREITIDIPYEIVEPKLIEDKK